MKSIILYAAKHGTGCASPYWPVYPEGGDDPVFVRAEVVESDLLHALDTAKPKDDEVLLNTIEFHAKENEKPK